jgi:hypothetical protein
MTSQARTVGYILWNIAIENIMGESPESWAGLLVPGKVKLTSFVLALCLIG